MAPSLHQVVSVPSVDEMYTRIQQVHKQIGGFRNLGEVNNHLLAFEHSVDADGTTHPSLAETMMIFMHGYRGLFTPLWFAHVEQHDHINFGCMTMHALFHTSIGILMHSFLC